MNMDDALRKSKVISTSPMTAKQLSQRHLGVLLNYFISWPEFMLSIFYWVSVCVVLILLTSLFYWFYWFVFFACSVFSTFSGKIKLFWLLMGSFRIQKKKLFVWLDPISAIWCKLQVTMQPWCIAEWGKNKRKRKNAV